MYQPVFVEPQTLMLSEGSLQVDGVGEEAPGLVWLKVRASWAAAG